jgi:DNA-directed RNA polymerase specialized sigma24 family protein
VLQWLTGADARAATRAIVRRYDLPLHVVDDVLQDAWLRAHRTLTTAEDQPHFPVPASAVAYARRVITNAVIDRYRRACNRRELPLGSMTTDHDNDTDSDHAASEADPSTAAVALDEVEWRQTALALRIAVARSAQRLLASCRGCSNQLVAAVALHVCNALAISARRGSFEVPVDDLIYDGLRRHDRVTFSDAVERPNDAQRQKKRRCTPCVKNLLGQAARDAGVGSSS